MRTHLIRRPARDIIPPLGESRDSNLFLIGFVRFRDIFDKRHITLSCLKFSKRDNWFYFDGDERYNSTHQET
jgi:hypothetical protein